MVKHCNPYQQKGERNLFCNHYSNCLDYVIQKDWPNWDCTQCVYKRSDYEKPIVINTGGDSFDYHDLSPEFDHRDAL